MYRKIVKDEYFTLVRLECKTHSVVPGYMGSTIFPFNAHPFSERRQNILSAVASLECVTIVLKIRLGFLLVRLDNLLHSSGFKMDKY